MADTRGRGQRSMLKVEPEAANEGAGLPPESGDIGGVTAWEEAPSNSAPGGGRRGV